jgi:hypothetical protein
VDPILPAGVSPSDDEPGNPDFDPLRFDAGATAISIRAFRVPACLADRQRERCYEHLEPAMTADVADGKTRVDPLGQRPRGRWSAIVRVCDSHTFPET